MDYETQKMLDDIQNEIYSELDEIKQKYDRSQSYTDIDQNGYSYVQPYAVNNVQTYRSSTVPKKEWREYWAK